MLRNLNTRSKSRSLAVESLESRRVLAVGPYVHMHNNNQLAVVDAANGGIEVLATMQGYADNDGNMADIAFSPDGRLFGITDDWLYEIHPVTGRLTIIGQHTVPDANSLSFEDDGTLNIMGYGSLKLYEIHMNNGSISSVTQRATITADGATGANGDLTFVGSDLVVATNNNHIMWYRFDVAPDRPRRILDINLTSLGLNNVYGLTDVDGELYATTDNSVIHFHIVGANVTATEVDVTNATFGIMRGAAYFGESGDTVPIGTIAGHKWNDVNADGIKQAAEAYLADWQVYLDLDLDGQHDTTEPVRTTDARGQYFFFGIDPGTYTVDEIMPASGWEQTAPQSTHRNLIGDYDFITPTAQNDLFHDYGLADMRASGLNFGGGNAVIVNTNSFLELDSTLGREPFTIAIDATYNGTIGSTQYLVSQRLNANADSRDFDVTADGPAKTMSSTFCNAAGTCQSATQGLFDGGRHQVAITWDGTNVGNFFDTTLTTKALAGTRPDIDATLLRFGNPFAATTAAGLRGTIHTIRIYNKALTAAELQNAFNPTTTATGYSVVLGDEFGAQDLDFGNRVAVVVEKAPEIEVRAFDASGTILEDNVSSVDLGRTLTSEAPPSGTFWIKNIGTNPLLLSGLSVSAGFTLTGPALNSLSPGQSTSFTVTVSSNTAGNYGGVVTIVNNDSDENPFTFNVSAEILSADLRPRSILVNTTNGNIMKIDRTTNLPETLIAGGTVLNDIAYDPLHNKLYGIDNTRLFAIDLTAKTITALYSHGLSSPSALAASPTGELYAGAQNIYRLNVATQSSTQYAAGTASTIGDIEFVGTRMLLTNSAGDLYEATAGSMTRLGGLSGISIKGLAATESGALFGFSDNQPYDIAVSPVGITARSANYVLTIAGATYLPQPALHNATLPLDVNGDGIVAPIDVLLLINELNTHVFTDETGLITGTPPASTPYPDVDNNGYISALDALLIINHLNSTPAPAVAASVDAALAEIGAALNQDRRDSLESFL